MTELKGRLKAIAEKIKKGETMADIGTDHGFLPFYLAENADITAHCAVKVALARLPVILKGCQVLIVGWGRIGKCLGKLLKNMGAIVTIAARKETDRALAAALGYEVLDPASMSYELVRFRVVFNTVPGIVLDRERMTYCSNDCLKIELASVPGMEGDDVISARGLPGKEAPETSGTLIAKTVLRLLRTSP
jgi:dipicolinate synthase subunit A